jgi:hypothetical protein
VRGAAIASVAVAVVLGGCGGGNDDAAAVKSTVRAYLDAFVKGDDARTCSLMTAKTRAEFVKGARPLAKTDDCARATAAVRAAAGGKAIEALRSARISDVTVNGNSASAKLTASSGQSIATLTKEGGKWKVSSTLGSQ